MGFSSKKFGFGDKIQNHKKDNKSYTDKQFEKIKFEALKMHQKNRFDKAIFGYKKLIKYGIDDEEVFINLYQIYKKQARIKDSYIIYKTILTD